MSRRLDAKIARMAHYRGIILAIQYEGIEGAQSLAARGIAAFVLRYGGPSMPGMDEGFKAHRDLQMREPALLGRIIEAQVPLSIADGIGALKLLRMREADWHVDPRASASSVSRREAMLRWAASKYEAGERPDFCAII